MASTHWAISTGEDLSALAPPALPHTALALLAERWLTPAGYNDCSTVPRRDRDTAENTEV